MFGIQSSDLRPAVLRGLVVFAAIALPTAALGSALQAPPTYFLVSVLLLSALYGVTTTLLALVELRSSRSTWRVSGGFQVLLAGLLLAPILMLQFSFTFQVASSASVADALAQTWAAVKMLVLEMPWALAKVSFVFALPWAIVSAARLQRRTNPTLAVIGLTALIASPALALGFAVWAKFIGVALMIHALFRLADLIEWGLCRWGLRREVRALKARGLGQPQLWVLAAAGDPAARLLLGRKAPDEQPTLAGWMRQLVTCGTDALLQAVAATARLTQAWGPEHAPAFAALDAWATEPSPETVAEAEHALARLPERPLHPAGIAIREALTAVTATGAWAPETVRRAAARVAEQAAELNDLAAVRGTIASVIRERLQPGAPAHAVVGVAR